MKRDKIFGFEIRQIYWYYDQPVIYSCNLPNKLKSIVYLMKQKGHYQVWVYSIIEKKVLTELERNKLTLRKAILSSVGNRVGVVKEWFKKEGYKRLELSSMSCDQLDDKSLPEDSVLLFV